VWVHGSHIEADAGPALSRAFGLVPDVTEEEAAAAVRDAGSATRSTPSAAHLELRPERRCDYISRQ
jgi:hypothetical protein